MGEVVEFPYGEISNPVDDENWDYVLEHCQELIIELVDYMDELGYDAKDEQLIKDIGVVSNFLYAAMKRYVKQDHIMIEALDEIYDELEMIRKEIGDFN